MSVELFAPDDILLTPTTILLAKLLLAVILIFPPPLSATSSRPVEHPVVALPALFPSAQSPQFVSHDKQDYDAEVLAPLHEAQREKREKDRVACESKNGHMENGTCVVPPPPPPPVVEPPVPAYAPITYSKTITINNTESGTLMGSLGYSLFGGNCVNEPGINNPGFGNPIDWPITSRTPWIGATVLFYFNHTAKVSGVWSNGDIEVRHQNAGGAPHRYPASMIRGYR